MPDNGDARPGLELLGGSMELLGLGFPGGPALDEQGRVFGVASRGDQDCGVAVYGDVSGPVTEDTPTDSNLPPGAVAAASQATASTVPERPSELQRVTPGAGDGRLVMIPPVPFHVPVP